MHHPFMDLFPPANIKALAHDHEYKKTSMEEAFLEEHCISSASADYISHIETTTHDQALSSSWLLQIKMRITATRFGEICKATERKDKKALAKSIIVPEVFKSAAMLHGQKYE